MIFGNASDVFLQNLMSLASIIYYLSPSNGKTNIDITLPPYCVALHFTKSRT